jgi:hypothetical protein
LKKFIFGIFLAVLGTACWYQLANTARFSIKKWDGKFESVLRDGLTRTGFTNKDILSTVHEVKSGPEGQWVSHQMTLRAMDSAKRKELKEMFENAGAQVEERTHENDPVFLVKRRGRIYQQLRFVHP